GRVARAHASDARLPPAKAQSVGRDALDLVIEMRLQMTELPGIAERTADRDGDAIELPRRSAALQVGEYADVDGKPRRQDIWHAVRQEVDRPPGIDGRPHRPRRGRRTMKRATREDTARCEDTAGFFDCCGGEPGEAARPLGAELLAPPFHQ